MHLILNAHSSNEHYNGDCDYALVELTPALVEQIRSRVALAREAGQKDNNLYELYFWGSTAEFFDHNILDACQEAIATAGRRRRNKAARNWLADFEGQEYAVVPERRQPQHPRRPANGVRSTHNPLQPVFASAGIRDRLDDDTQAFGRVRHHQRPAAGGDGRTAGGPISGPCIAR